MKEELSSINIDTSTMDDQQQIDKIEQNISAETTNMILHPKIFDEKNVQELKQTDFHEIAKEEAKVIELKDNFLRTGLTHLEDLFDSNDISRKPKMQPLNAEIEDRNMEPQKIPNDKTVKSITC